MHADHRGPGVTAPAVTTVADWLPMQEPTGGALRMDRPPLAHFRRRAKRARMRSRREDCAHTKTRCRVASRR